jgi:uncharacterized delta-60 repeat protein
MLLLCGAAESGARPNTSRQPAATISFDAAALSSDGAIVVVGTAGPFRPGTTRACTPTDYFDADCQDRRPIVARFLRNGRRDTGFGGGRGYVLLPSVGMSPVGLAVDSHDRIVTLATSYERPAAVVTRLTPRGAFDVSFGSGGSATLADDLIAGSGRPLAIDRQDRVLIAGSGASRVNQPLSLLRLGPNGEPDPTFGSAGVASVRVDPADGGEQADAVTVLRDGRLMVAGTARYPSRGEPVAARLHSDGTPDASFDGDGAAVFPAPQGSDGIYGRSYRTEELVVDETGTTLIGLSAWPALAPIHGGCESSLASQITAAGAIDAGFGNDGFSSTQTCVSYGDLTVLERGEILLSGSDGGVRQTWLTPNGLEDRDRRRRLRVAGLYAGPAAVEHLADGSLVTIGTAPIPDCLPVRRAPTSLRCSVGFAMAQRANGNLDRSFGTRGVATIPATRICPDPFEVCPYPYRGEFAGRARRGAARDTRISGTTLGTFFRCPLITAERCKVRATFSIARTDRLVASVRGIVGAGTETLLETTLARNVAVAVRRSPRLKVSAVVEAKHQRPVRIRRGFVVSQL